MQQPGTGPRLFRCASCGSVQQFPRNMPPNPSIKCSACPGRVWVPVEASLPSSSLPSLKFSNSSRMAQQGLGKNPSAPSLSGEKVPPLAVIVSLALLFLAIGGFFYLTSALGKKDKGPVIAQGPGFADKGPGGVIQGGLGPDDIIKAMEKEEAEKEKKKEEEARIIAEEKKKKADWEKKKGPGYNSFDPILVYIDKHALSATKEQEKDIETLAAYLTGEAKNHNNNEYYRVRAIYTWLTHKVEYDKPGLVKGVPRENDAVAVLKNKKGVCHGQANLFKALCEAQQIEAKVISGPVKIQNNKTEQHAWNAVKIYGQWRLLDPTWGNMIDDNNLEKKFMVNPTLKSKNEYHFLTPPKLMIIDHFPSDPDHQYLPRPKSRVQFDKEPNYFIACNSGEALECGYPLDGFIKHFKEIGPAKMCITRPVFCPIKVLEMPLEMDLLPGQEYTFKFQLPAQFRPDIGLNNGELVAFKNMGNGIHQITIKLEKKVLVQVVIWPEANQFKNGNLFAEYNVPKK